MNACGPVVNGLNCMLAACDCSFCIAEQVVPLLTLLYSVSTKKRPPKYNGVVFEILGRHH